MLRLIADPKDCDTPNLALARGRLAEVTAQLTELWDRIVPADIFGRRCLPCMDLPNQRSLIDRHNPGWTGDHRKRSAEAPQKGDVEDITAAPPSGDQPDEKQARPESPSPFETLHGVPLARTIDRPSHPPTGAGREIQQRGGIRHAKARGTPHSSRTNDLRKRRRTQYVSSISASLAPILPLGGTRAWIPLLLRCLPGQARSITASSTEGCSTMPCSRDAPPRWAGLPRPRPAPPASNQHPLLAAGRQPSSPFCCSRRAGVPMAGSAARGVESAQ